MSKNPYLQVMDPRRMMGGIGAPRSTVFGVLGRTKYDPYTRSLGGLIERTTSGPMPRHEVTPVGQEHKNTDRHLLGPAGKTRVPGQHYGQVPYAGAFRSHLGDRM